MNWWWWWHGNLGRLTGGMPYHECWWTDSGKWRWTAMCLVTASASRRPPAHECGQSVAAPTHDCSSRPHPCLRRSSSRKLVLASLLTRKLLHRSHPSGMKISGVSEICTVSDICRFLCSTDHDPTLFHPNFGVFPLDQIAHVAVSPSIGLHVKLISRDIFEVL